MRAFQEIYTGGIVPVLRGIERTKCERVVNALREGGINIVEITVDTPNCMEMLQKLAAETDMVIGAGTVLDGETARNAILSGAEYIVTPGCFPQVIKTCRRYRKPVIVGALTPTEIVTAFEEGADIVKVFPAGPLGLQYFKDIRGPLGQIPMMPSGGINLANVKDYILAGASAVSVGGALVKKEYMTKEQYHLIRDLAQEFVKTVKEGRKVKQNGCKTRKEEEK
jgi:2-dehydro-3-deoxyphosphogluconate aldolase/(4S)-4-hydroxy-2-oxoglutarate aldolase